MITYSTNWMGPINQKWIEEHGEGWSAGRIDIRDDTKHGYNGWHEYSVRPMRTEDWNALSDYLWDLTTEELLPYDTLIERFEEHYGKKIRWASEYWYTCLECGLITDLRKHKKHIHKMDCGRGRV